MLVKITPQASKHYKKLSHSQQLKIKKRLLVLANKPLAGKKLFGKLSETRSLRAWPYRIIYYIDTKNKTIFVVSILHRQGVYK